MSEERKFPPYIVNHPEDGLFRIGQEDKDEERKSCMEAHAGSDATILLFKDGGWQIRSAKAQDLINPGSSIENYGKGPLIINADSDIRIKCGGEFNVRASKITMTADGSGDPTFSESLEEGNGNIKMTSVSNEVFLEAGNSAKIKGKQVAIVATTKMIAETTSGGMILAGQFVHVHEKVSQLIPQNMINIKSAYPSFKGTS
tara:strand:+ start:132 stop:734 length:603 start_codon:yes stop_codon:yes gene_type:complete